jgi:hypothetical protein
VSLRFLPDPDRLRFPRHPLGPEHHLRHHRRRPGERRKILPLPDDDPVHSVTGVRPLRACFPSRDWRVQQLETRLAETHHLLAKMPSLLGVHLARAHSSAHVERLHQYLAEIKAVEPARRRIMVAQQSDLLKADLRNAPWQPSQSTSAEKKEDI